MWAGDNWIRLGISLVHYTEGLNIESTTLIDQEMKGGRRKKVPLWPLKLGHDIKEKTNTLTSNTLSLWMFGKICTETWGNIITPIIWQQRCHPSKRELCSDGRVWHLIFDDLCFPFLGWRHFLWQLGCDARASIMCAFLGLGPAVTQPHTHTRLCLYLCEDSRWHISNPNPFPTLQ